jgi:chromosome segregation ATPase
LLAGLREARQVSAEAVSKVATDVAIKNLELEHDHMKFMMQIGVQLEQFIMGFASDTGKLVLEANGQAMEMVKLVLTGMIQINDAMIKIYLAKWEGYKAAVEVFKAKISAVEAQIRVYEAAIRAELAKVEINKATVDILQTVAMTNKAIADVYKTEVDAATARIEADRVRVMAYEASVRAYSVQVEAYKAKWDGYKSRVMGEEAKARVYESQVSGYNALIGAYKTEIEGYSALVHNQAVQIDAIAKTNDSALRAWTAKLDGVIRSYVAGVEAYGTEWRAVAEQLRGEAEGLRIVADSLFKGYESEARIDTERAHEHMAEWRAQLEATLNAAKGLGDVATVSAQMASSALNGLTSFAGGLATTGSSG